MSRFLRNASLVTLSAMLAITVIAQTPPGGRAPAKKAKAPTESVRPPASHKVALAVTGLMGWHAGVASTAAGDNFLDAAVKTDAVGLGTIEGFSTQKAGPQIAKNLDAGLSDAERAAVKAKLQALSMDFYAYHVDRITGTDRAPFDFAKAMGAHVVVGPAAISDLAAIDKLAVETGEEVAIESKDARGLLAALEGRSSHLGAALDAKSAAGAKDRLKVLEVSGGDVAQSKVFLDIAKDEPAPEEHPNQCGNCGRPYGGSRPLMIVLAPANAATVETFERAVRPAMGYRVDQSSKQIPITSTDKIPAAERKELEAAIPKQALVKPKKPRKLLAIDLSPGGGYYHNTVAHTILALQLMAKNTGAFEPVFSNDLSNLKYPKIKQFDGVFLDSVVGEVFPDPEVLGGLTRFVREGGGVAGIHGTTYASMDLAEFSDLMGAADGPHRVEQATLKVDDPNSPIVKQFNGQPIVHTDEFYHFLQTGPFSREKLHVLLSIDTSRSDMSPWQGIRSDNDFGSVWIKSYGKGRVFNCAMGHTPLFYATPGFEQMILNAIQFIVGDLPADTTPSAKLAAGK